MKNFKFCYVQNPQQWYAQLGKKYTFAHYKWKSVEKYRFAQTDLSNFVGVVFASKILQILLNGMIQEIIFDQSELFNFVEKKTLLGT